MDGQNISDRGSVADPVHRFEHLRFGIVRAGPFQDLPIVSFDLLTHTLHLLQKRMQDRQQPGRKDGETPWGERRRRARWQAMAAGLHQSTYGIDSHHAPAHQHVASAHHRQGLLGGHAPMGDRSQNSWLYRTHFHGLGNSCEGQQDK
jgi:hypothetical protein